MTEGREWRLILLFTLPIMAGNFLQQLYNTVDSIIVGRILGEAALSAVGTSAPITMLFVAIAMGMSTGCSVITAQYFGAKQLDEMRKSVSTSIILLVGVGIFLTVLGFFVTPVLLRDFLKAGAEYLPMATSYLRIYCLGLVFQFIYNIAAAILRSLGDSRATLYFLLVSSVANIILDILLVPVMGVAGAALATVIAQALSAAISIFYMFRVHTLLRVPRSLFRFYPEKGLLALKIALPTTVQQCVVSFSHMALQRLVNSYDITAAYTAGTRLENFLLIPIFGFNMGLSTFTGQNLGAGKPERVIRGHKVTLLMGCICWFLVMVIVYTCAGPLLSLFNLAADSLAVGQTYLRFMAPLVVIFALYMITNGALQGAGDVIFIFINTFSALVVRVLLAYGLSAFTSLGAACVWYSIPLTWLYNMVLSLARFRFGPWRQKTIVSRQADEG